MGRNGGRVDTKGKRIWNQIMESGFSIFDPAGQDFRDENVRKSAKFLKMVFDR